MKACIILHNIIVEDERYENEVVDLDYNQIDGVDNLLYKCHMNKLMELGPTFKVMNALEFEKFIHNFN